ncbi:MAG: hypothetical protein ACRET4_03265 [Steroidobacteraceae bacterium]
MSRFENFLLMAGLGANSKMPGASETIDKALFFFDVAAYLVLKAHACTRASGGPDFPLDRSEFWSPEPTAE